MSTVTPSSVERLPAGLNDPLKVVMPVGSEVSAASSNVVLMKFAPVAPDTREQGNLGTVRRDQDRGDARIGRRTRH